MNALLAVNAHIVNAILIENENYNINDKHLTNYNYQMRCELGTGFCSQNTLTTVEYSFFLIKIYH